MKKLSKPQQDIVEKLQSGEYSLKTFISPYNKKAYLVWNGKGGDMDPVNLRTVISLEKNGIIKASDTLAIYWKNYHLS